MEIEDEDIETSGEDTVETSENDDGSDEDTKSDRKNQSNWKKMSEAKKALERDLKAEREEKAQLSAQLKELKDWANSLYQDESQKPFAKKEEEKIDDKAEKLETKIFLLENKDARDYLDDINSARLKYNMDFDEAWTFVKAKLPPESKTKKEFDLSNKPVKLPKDLKTISPEDALNLSKDDQAKWRKANGWE